MNTENNTITGLQLCTVQKGKGDAGGYIEGRKYTWAATCRGFVEIEDLVTRKISYETNECFARNFSKL